MDVVDGKIVSAGSDRSSETWSTRTSAVTATSSNSSTCDPPICELAEESVIPTPEAASRNYIVGTSAPPGWATSSWRMTPTAGGQQQQVRACGEYYFNSHPASSFMAPSCLSSSKMQVAGRHLPLASGMMSTNMPNPSDNRWGGVAATPAGAFVAEGAAAAGGGGDEYHSNTHHNYNNFFHSAGAQHHPRLSPNRFLPPPLPLPGEGDGGGICSGSGVGHADARVMDHGMATMLRMIPCDSGASLRAPNVQTHIPMRGGGGEGGRVVPQDLASDPTQLHHHRIKRPHGYRRLYHLHQRRHHQQHQLHHHRHHHHQQHHHQHQHQQHHQHQHQQHHHHQHQQHHHHQHQQHPQQAQQCQAVDHRPPNPATLFDQEMRMFESRIAQTASRNIQRQPPPPSPSLLPAHVAAFAERLVPSPPLSLADHEDDDDHYLPWQGALKPGGASRGRGVNEILQGEGSNVQQDARIMSSSSCDHLTSSISQLSTQTETEAEAAAVFPATLEHVGPVGGSFGSSSGSAGKKAALPLAPGCELSEMMCLSSSHSQQQQQPPCGWPSPGASRSHKRKTSEPVEDEFMKGSPWIEPLRFLVRKGLTISDCGELGRVVLPKKDAEAQLPWIDSKEGALLTMTDYETMKQWLFRYKWWLNNKSRMYVLENTGEFIKYHELKENDAMLLYKDASGKLVVHGEKNLNSEPSHAPHQQSCKSPSPRREM